MLRVAIFTGVYVTAATAAAVVTGNTEFLFYVGVLVVLAGVVVGVHRAVGLPEAALWALSAWGLLHMAGGLVPVPAGLPVEGAHRVLYSLWLVPGRIKYDHVVHAYGFGVTTWICWLGLRATLRHTDPDPRPTAGRLVLAGAAGLGFGALNEVVEFVATLLVPDTNVGGYVNTGWDLVSNLTGACVAVILIRLLAGRRARA